MPQALIVVPKSTTFSVGMSDVFDCTAYSFIKSLPGNRVCYLVSGSAAQLTRIKKLPGPYKDVDWKVKPEKDAMTQELATDAEISNAQSLRQLLPYTDVADKDALPE